ncbi:MAG: type II toxin-antitoxin system PemK/MazF family toxin [Patescibacteria group bacterium]|nr:type II toxin-antitoxin system PemK/MazF family toxin [Patescibacteria group bacterium]
MSNDQSINTHDRNTELIDKIKRIVSWLYVQIELSQAYYQLNSEKHGLPQVRMGDIYHARLGTNIGSEIDKNRPVMIFQGCDPYIDESNMVTLIPISSNLKERPYRISFSENDIIDNKGISGGSIVIQQIRSVSKIRLTEYNGRLSDQKIRDVITQVNSLLYKALPPALRQGGHATNVGREMHCVQ